jgi:exopolyphosphatase/guanosine-5'-triphosphate,3'-diphosphate pyrophosphatase
MAESRKRRQRGGRGRGPRHSPIFAVLDLGTNNCRLLIARPEQGGKFRVIDSFSRIVRLGEGVAQTGNLSDAAITRTLAALRVCADRIRANHATHVRAIATEACRRAANAQVLLDRAMAEAGVELQVLTADEEAHLAATGCAPLVGRRYEGALIFDIGGGSTEAIWMQRENDAMRVRKAISVPAGVITIAEHQPGPMTRARYQKIFSEMFDRFADVRAEMDRVATFDPGKHHLLGTSGTVTTLAGIALGLPRYIRAKVDASWHESVAILKIAEDIAGFDHQQRAKLACVGPERAELIVPGCAIFSAIHAHWPCTELRVADRGLREGMLREMMDAHR